MEFICRKGVFPFFSWQVSWHFCTFWREEIQVYVLERREIDTVSEIIEAGNKWRRGEITNISSTYLYHLRFIQWIWGSGTLIVWEITILFRILTQWNYKFSQMGEDLPDFSFSLNYNGRILQIGFKILLNNFCQASKTLLVYGSICKGDMSEHSFHQYNSIWPHPLFWPWVTAKDRLSVLSGGCCLISWPRCSFLCVYFSSNAAPLSCPEPINITAL